jgi:hypothetical protein
MNRSIERSRKNTESGETIDVSKVSKGFKYISGCMVTMHSNDDCATPQQKQTLKLYRPIFTDYAEYYFNEYKGIVVENETNKYIIARGGGVIATHLRYDSGWVEIN